MTTPIDGPFRVNFGSALRKKTNALNRSAVALASGKANIGAVEIGIANRLENLASVASVGANSAQVSLGRINVASEGLNQASDLLGKLGSLSARAIDSTLTANDRQVLNTEAQDVVSQLSSLVSDTSFNGQKVLQGDSVTVHVGDPVQFSDPDGNNVLTPLAGIDLTTTANAETALTQVNDALGALSSERAINGSSYNTVSRAQEIALTESAELHAAADNIASTDLVKEVSNFVAARTDLEVTSHVVRMHQLSQKRVLDFLTGHK